MQVQVSGKHVDVGEALRSRIVTELSNGIGKYFERGGDADVVVTREGHMFRMDTVVTLASGQQLVGHAYGADAHGAFDGMLERIEKRVRRYKRRLKNHHASNGKSGQETAPVTVLRAPDEVLEEDYDDHLAEADASVPPAAMVIAETERPVRTMTVSMAVMDLDLSNYPVILFRNAAHGGLAVVYRRPDGNIGWIDPERTR
ncbi:ribosome hibernation-promoting factor, HPF/YfiA family [Caulobacter sp. 17J80-11]|uniref:ribosome hibernation-promoting factor, HPF/YfiA family n=1 Tax=Caulobacter sp. 17J80-11 TaxID=2763502 RepID=UPI0016536473|nr:ribosome-associated translation inhibitor RaiA [Caulobacter sp. 17J80-11]MBC6981501.1 ribosome-associated translation inhibitor RaiA [Caulobacter sp. 17J80-11]